MSVQQKNCQTGNIGGQIDDLCLGIGTAKAQTGKHCKRNNQECAVVNSYEETITNLRTVIIDEYLFEQTLLAAQSCYRTENRLTPEEAAEALIDATRIYLAELR